MRTYVRAGRESQERRGVPLPGARGRGWLVRISFLTVVTAIGLLRSGAFASSASTARREASPAAVAQSDYVVQRGDSLWSIARMVDAKADPRPLVDRLARAHGGALLRAGDRIALPPHAGP